MCELTRTSRASFYRDWEAKEPTVVEMELRELIQREALAHRGYGYRRIKELVARQGVEVGAATVRRLMKDDNLLAVRKKKFVRTTDSEHRFLVHPNLAQDLIVNDINQLWVADLTYIRLRCEFVYLAVVLDAFSRRVVGWALGRSLDASLTLTALNRAVEARQPKPGLVHHSDRGSQYACGVYVTRLEGIGAILSMSRPGRPWENGKCESLIKTLKAEQINAYSYADMAELERQLEEFIETFYNPLRLHSALGYCSPLEFEQQRLTAPAVAWHPAALSFLRHKEI